jgi:hypothetical protein
LVLVLVRSPLIYHTEISGKRYLAEAIQNRTAIRADWWELRNPAVFRS